MEAAWNTATGPVAEGGIDLEAIALRHDLADSQERAAAAAAGHAKQGFAQDNLAAGRTTASGPATRSGTVRDTSPDLGR